MPGVPPGRTKETIMKRSVQRATEARKLSMPYQQQLNSYAIAATAAGVSILSLAGLSQAKIVYTPTHHVIGDRSSYRLHFTGDENIDLTIQNKYIHHCNTYTCSTSESLTVNLPASNQAVHNVFGAVAMKPGMRIGPRDAFAGGHQVMAFGFNSFGGSWINVKNRYLGVKFKIKGEYHYGWARLSVTVERPLTITATLTGYAYETIANKAIAAGQTKGPDNTTIEEPNASLTAPSPEPATLGTLALGAPGLTIWRRRELVGGRP
jgi:hypothetical protein